MRKPLAILMLLLFLFNIIGYKALFYMMEQKADATMEERMDNMKEAGHDAITVKIPINLPYQTNWEGFERVDGEMTYRGVTYKYFKRRIYKDSLILVCLKFTEKTKLQHANNDYFKKVNDLAAESNKKQSKQAKNDDYCQLLKLELPVIAVAKPPVTLAGYSNTYVYNFTQKLLMPPRV